MCQIINILSFIRFFNLLIASLTVCLCFHLLNCYNYIQLFVCVGIVIFSMIFGNIMNDLMDIKTDTINRPNRLLVKKMITASQAKLMLFITVLALCPLLSFLSYKALLFYGFLFCLLIFYNILFKKTPFIGNMIISFLLSSVVIFTELMIFGNFEKLLPLALLAFYISLIREVIKDLEDYKGDQKTNYYTLPILIGKKKTRYFVISLIIIFCAICLMPIYININYLLYIIIIIEIPMFYSLFLLIKQPTKKEFSQISMILKGVIMGGLFIIFLINN
ncbi:MAG: hypothetical protein CMG64_00905 [Candidatus Marinimicrobia bacterium]|nr:hypothetical protein [Candidatus Neomarinimicrobiota bacterium]